MWGGGFCWGWWGILPVGTHFPKKMGRAIKSKWEMEGQREWEICRIMVKCPSHWRMGEQATRERREENYRGCWIHKSCYRAYFLKLVYLFTDISPPCQPKRYKLHEGSSWVCFTKNPSPQLRASYIACSAEEYLLSELVNKWVNAYLETSSSPSKNCEWLVSSSCRWVFWRGEGRGFAENCQRVMMVRALKPS